MHISNFLSYQHLYIFYKKNNKDVYNVFIQDIHFCAKHEHKWETLLELDDTFICISTYKALFHCTKAINGWNIGYSIEFSEQIFF